MANQAMNEEAEAYLRTVIPKRISLFESIQNQQKLHRLSLSPDPIKISLPGGIVREGKKWNTSPSDVAKEISKSLAKKALVAKVNGVLWDMNRPLEEDCDLKILTFDDDEGKHTFWHSSSHILGQSLEQNYGCKLCIGPCTNKGDQLGFYYDAFYGGNMGLNDEHFERIENGAQKAVSMKPPQHFERIEVTMDQALEIFSENPFKVEIIRDLLHEDKSKTITVYRCGPLVDLCRGPHLPDTSFVKAFSCLRASAAYWRGKQDRESLQRVYGISFPDPRLLKEFKDALEEAKKNDHRELNVNQNLFFSKAVSPGSFFFESRGVRVCNRLIDFIQKEYWKRDYARVKSPMVYKMGLWETSGHAAKYKENMFLFCHEKQELGLKPMNCPGHCLMFDGIVRFAEDLPLRFADFGVLHRNEANGALSGLTRVRRFMQDDAHIFCMESQVKDEVKRVLKFISYAYEIFGFTFELKLSTRPEKSMGDAKVWEKAEEVLKEALDEFEKPWEMNEGDGAFYGPKIDIVVNDAMKRKFQCATLQLDFQLPERFKLSYVADEEDDGGDCSKLERPVMIHRAVLGSVERMFAILFEHYKGKWPFWLSPRQAIICPVSEKYLEYGRRVRQQLHDAGYYVDVDSSDRTLNKKVREAKVVLQYNYILVVGEKEAENGQVSVRVRESEDRSVVSVEDLLKEFKAKVDAHQ